jgi:hypothetical protein
LAKQLIVDLKPQLILSGVGLFHSQQAVHKLPLIHFEVSGPSSGDISSSFNGEGIFTKLLIFREWPWRHVVPVAMLFVIAASFGIVEKRTLRNAAPFRVHLFGRGGYGSQRDTLALFSQSIDSKFDQLNGALALRTIDLLFKPG